MDFSVSHQTTRSAEGCSFSCNFDFDFLRIAAALVNFEGLTVYHPFLCKCKEVVAELDQLLSHAIELDVLILLWGMPCNAE